MALISPQAMQRPKLLEKHGHTREDVFYWLNERDSPEVLAYLEQENQYTEAIMAATADFQEALYHEMRGRIKEDDSTAPIKREDFVYYNRFETGKEYAIHCRKPANQPFDSANEIIMLDENVRAQGHKYYKATGFALSYNQRMIVFGEDTVSRRIYTLYFKDVSADTYLPDTITNTAGEACFAADNKTIFYIRKHPETLRAYQLWKHILGTNAETDILVYEETDEAYTISLGTSKSKEYLFLYCHSTLTTEVRMVKSIEINSEWKPFLKRETGHEYMIDHLNGVFYIHSNWEAKNFRILQVPDHLDYSNKNNWEEILPTGDTVLIEGVEPFYYYVAFTERVEGLLRIRIRELRTGEEHFLDFGEPTYAAYLGLNPEADTTVLRYHYTSLTTPNSVFEYDMKTRTKTLIKQQAVLGDFAIENYQSERVWATASDGRKIPISLVYRKGFQQNGTHPLYQYAYGSYGHSIDAYFSSSRLSLLDRGVVFAIAHVRGGQELGRYWYEEGKLLNKKNTFTDFITCTEYLIKEGYAAADKVIASGGSAGGLLIGAVANMRGDLYRAMIANVPFVDVVTTMLDDSIPLTTGEYDEWGNPHLPEYYHYMLSYSPYDNVRKQNYPHMLVTTGYHDSQVQYWEPAKWVAKLRLLKTDNNLLLFKTRMEAGHGGLSGRFEALKDIAFEYAFIFHLLGIYK